MSIEGAPVKIVRLFRAGHTVSELATRFAIDVERVCRILRAARAYSTANPYRAFRQLERQLPRAYLPERRDA